MKKLLILLLSFSFLLACNNNKTSDKRSDRDTSATREKDDRGGDNDGDDKGNDGKIDRNSGKYDDVVDDDEEGNHIPESNWTTTDVKIFVTSCVNEAVKGGMSRSVSEDYCNCMQQKLERLYPNSAQVSRFKQDSPEAIEMAQDCLGLNDKKSTSSSSGWSRKDELDFVNDCVDAAEKQGMEYLDAQSYCDCMQFKIEKIYPDFRDASRLTDADLATPSMKKMIRDCLPGN